MILDNLEYSYVVEPLHPLFKQAFDYIKATDWSQVEPGKIVLKGDDLFINVSTIEAKTVEQARMETHQQYIDIQVPLNRSERMGWRRASDCKEITTAYNPEKDIAFYAEKGTTHLDVQPGEFVVFYPEDGHAPGIGEGIIEKLIVKVRVAI